MNRLPLLVAFVLVAPTTCRACATVEIEELSTRITDEAALIVWDAKSNTEHFVRRANFQTKAKNFGFLVPTPSQPQLAPANDGLFNDLEQELLPKTKTVVQRGINPTPFIVALGNIQGCAGGDAEEANAAASNTAASANATESVEVIEQKRVGNYNASVLRANDTPSLLLWLTDHHYSITPETRAWLEPYVKAGFFLTAFQIAVDTSNQTAQASAVRLTFKSDYPFYPYKELQSAQKSKADRSLRVFYVGSNRVEANIENHRKTAQWPSSMQYSGPLDAKVLLGQGVSAPDGPLRLTTFEDGVSPRPGWGDLKFYPARDQSELVPLPHIIYKDKRWWVPLDVLALLGVCFAGWGARFHKRRSI